MEITKRTCKGSNLLTFFFFLKISLATYNEQNQYFAKDKGKIYKTFLLINILFVSCVRVIKLSEVTTYEANLIPLQTT